MTSRRKMLAALGGLVGTGLAGCIRQDDTPNSTDTDTPTDAPTDTETTSSPTDNETTSSPTDTGTTTTSTETDTETDTPTDTPTETPSTFDVTINNVGVSAWEVTAGAANVDAGGGENPTLTFTVGERYRITNNGWSFHPFALRAADDSPLLSQSADGSFEQDSAVNWVDNGDTLAFTMTEELAAELDYYICTVHSSMRGAAEAQ